MSEVQKVLAEIGAADVPQVLVFNKLDAIAPEQWPVSLHDQYIVDGRVMQRFFVSAHTGEGLAALREFLAQEALQDAPPPVWGSPEDHDLTNGPALT